MDQRTVEHCGVRTKEGVDSEGTNDEAGANVKTSASAPVNLAIMFRLTIGMTSESRFVDRLQVKDGMNGCDTVKAVKILLTTSTYEQGANQYRKYNVG